MFTGLKAVNHFGRPDMSSFLKFVQKKHSYVSFKVNLINQFNKHIFHHRSALGLEDWSVFMWSETTHQKCHVSMR